MKKTLGILITLLICLFANETFSQELKETYFGIATDSTQNHHYLKFENDSIAKITFRHRHMFPRQEQTYTYSTRKGVIRLKPNMSDTLTNIVVSRLKLEIDEKALIDRTNKVVYFLYDDYDDLNVTTFIIDGEEYRQKNTVANSYGIVEKTPRRNKKLKQKMKEIEPTIGKYEIEIIKGIDAYNTYGYEYVFGVIKLSRK